MFSHILEFIIDFITHLNVQKVIGAIIALVGLSLISRVGTFGNVNIGLMFGVGGILIGGVGFIIIYHDMAKDKIAGGYDELHTLDEAYKLENRKLKATAWHMNDEPVDKVPGKSPDSVAGNHDEHHKQ